MKIKIYDILGKEIYTILEKKMEKGTHTVSYDASNLSSGLYIYSLETYQYFATKIFSVLK